MPTINELQTQIDELKEKLSEKDKTFEQFIALLRNHTHSGSQSSGRLEPQSLKTKTLIVGNGASGSFNSEGDAETITVVSGIITAIT